MGFSVISVDGSTPSALIGQAAGNPNGPGWLTATDLVYQNYTGSAFVQQYNVSTHALTTLDSHGANTVAAGGGTWAAWLNDATVGVRTNIGVGPFLTGVLGDVSNDGELVVIRQYPEFIGLNVYDAGGGSLVSLPDVTVVPMSGTGVLRCRNHLLVYIDQSTGWRMVNVIGGSFGYRPRLNEPINWTVPVTTAAGKTYVLELSDRITVRPASVGKGWQLQPLGTITYNPDIIEQSAGVLRIGWSSNAGESPEALNLLDLTVATGATRLGTVSGGMIVWADGPTLPLEDFAVGPLQGSSDSTQTQIPTQEQPVTDEKDRLTLPYRQYLSRISGQLQTNTVAIAANPVLPVTPSFGSLAGGAVPIQATMPGDTATILSPDGSIRVTSDPLSKSLFLRIAPGSMGIPGLDGEDGHDAPVIVGPMGPSGPIGPSGLGIPGHDGQDGDSGVIFLSSSSASSSGGSWIPLVSGAEPPVFITDGAGVLILVGGPS